MHWDVTEELKLVGFRILWCRLFFSFMSTCKVNRYIWAVYVGNYQFNITATEMQLS